jgi:hypothetical protein
MTHARSGLVQRKSLLGSGAPRASEADEPQEHVEDVELADATRPKSARDWLVELYEAWGKPEKAAEWRTTKANAPVLAQQLKSPNHP